MSFNARECNRDRDPNEPVSSSERRLKVIYEWLDLGNNKKALQESERLLKKVPDLNCAKALKALSLIRLKRIEDALRILDHLKSLELTDEYTLQAMTFCFLELKQFHNICKIYEKAVEKETNSEDLYSHLFMSYVRIFDFKQQKKIAVILYKLKQKNSYYYWSVMSILLEAIYYESHDRNRQIILLNLAKKMMEKILKEQTFFDAVPQLQMYFWILRSLNKFDDILRFLSNKKFLGELLVNEQHEYQFESLMLLERWADLHNFCTEVLYNEMDKWNVWKLYFKSSLQIIRANRIKAANNNNNNNKNNHCYCDHTFERMHDFIGSLIRRISEKRKRVRGPFLARLELYKCIVESNEDPKRMQVTIDELIMNYLIYFGDKLCATADLKPYIKLIQDEEKRVDFCLEMLSLCRMDPGGFESIDQLRMYATSLQLLRICGYHLHKESQNNYESFAQTAYETYILSLSQAKQGNSPIKDRDSIDMFGLLAVHYYYDVAIHKKTMQPIFVALQILHQMLNDNSHNYHAKLLSIKLCHLLGCAEAANKFYKSLEVKQMQLDSLAYIHCIPSSQYGLLKSTNQLFDSTLSFFYGSDLDCIDQITYAYKFGSFLKINEFIEFRDKLKNSLNYCRISLTKFFSQIVMCSHIDHIVNLDNIPMDFDVEHLVDNQDYDIFLNWNPVMLQSEYEDMKSKLLAEYVEIVRVQYDLVKFLELFFQIFKTDNVENLNDFSLELLSSLNSWNESLSQLRTFVPVEVHEQLSLLLPSNIEVIQKSPCENFMTAMCDYICDLLGTQIDDNNDENHLTRQEIVEKLLRLFENLPVIVEDLLIELQCDNNNQEQCYLEGFWTLRTRIYGLYDIVEVASLVILSFVLYRKVLIMKKNDPGRKNRKKNTTPIIENFLSLITACQKCLERILNLINDWKFVCNKIDACRMLKNLKLDFQSTNDNPENPKSTALNLNNGSFNEIFSTLLTNRKETIQEIETILKDKIKLLHKLTVFS